MQEKHRKEFGEASTNRVILADAMPKTDFQYTEEIIFAMAEQAAVKIHGTMAMSELYARRQEIISMAAGEANIKMFGPEGPQIIADFYKDPERRMKIMGDFIQDYINGRRLDSMPPSPGYRLN